MKIKTVWLVVGLLLVLSLTACSGSPIIIGGSPPVTRQMTASGIGQVFLTPDIVYVSIGVESRAENVSTALTRNNAQAKAIANALEAMGVEAKDIQTSAFNVYPQTTYNPLGEPGPVEYVVNNTVYVTVRDLQSMGKLLDTVVRAGANT
ncbi:MAG: SIMPL domain-containing protein, partial [Anaerolineaceae bacterium]|nr:SIMPL domain-containing protein [Anaerolineaceae bacterium]